ncbi:MAG: succinate dehydrogenase iron-sulfur subunit [Pseudomonadota bacterium]
MSNIKFKIYRYDPEKDDKPYMQDFTLELAEDNSNGKEQAKTNGADHAMKQDIMLLQALILLKKQDQSISFRRSCREGVCGSDGMNINGKNGLACITPLLSLKQPIVLRPLPGFPVVRDLVVDMTQFYKQYERIEPYLQNSNNPPALERTQTPQERNKLDGLYECILCACCSSSCPSYWWNPDKFVGPAGLLWAYRFLADTRDDATDKRLANLEDPFSVFRCRGIMNCVNVCPKGLNPTKAISHIRSMLLERET